MKVYTLHWYEPRMRYVEGVFSSMDNAKQHAETHRNNKGGKLEWEGSDLHSEARLFDTLYMEEKKWTILQFEVDNVRKS